MESVGITKLTIVKFSENANVETNNKQFVVLMEEHISTLVTSIVLEEEKPFTGENANMSILRNVDVDKPQPLFVDQILRLTAILVLLLA